MKTPKYIDKHAGRVKDFGKTLEEEYPKVTPIDEFRKMFTVRDDDSAFSDDADCSFRESVLKKLTKTIESEREKVIGEIRGMKVRHATNTKGKVTKDDKPWQIELQKNIDVFNRTIDKIISKLK